LSTDFITKFLSAHEAELISLCKKIVTAGVIALACRLLMTIVRKITTKVSKAKLGIDETILSLLRIVSKYALVVIAIIMILGVFGVNTTGLVAILGAAGVAVGLALKDTLGNIAAGIVLVLLRSYRKGDFIEFGSFMGTVKDFDLFTTSLETPDGVFISAPNASIWASPLKNYSRNSRRRMDFTIGISYSDSIETAYQTLRAIVDAEQRFLKDPVPQIMVQSLGDNAVNITLRAWAESGVYWDAYWFQMKNIKEKIEAAGLSIPLPQRDIHIVEYKKDKFAKSRE
jgi:small conductance mechanosensitive channel